MSLLSTITMSYSRIWRLLCFTAVSCFLLMFAYENNISYDNLMTGLLRCPQTQVIKSPSDIHILLYYSSDVSNNYNVQIQTMIWYSKWHGYKLHILDPYSIMKTVMRWQRICGSEFITCTKPLAIEYAMKNIFMKSGCRAQWLVYIDADVFISDYEKPLETYIEEARSTKPCSFIGQDSPSSINAGFLFFRFSPTGYRLVHHWIMYQDLFFKKNVPWQADQGWLQYTYLKYAQFELQNEAPYSCSDRQIKAIPKYSRMPFNSMRNLCYVNSLAYLGLFPGNRSVGEACLLSGISPSGRFNMKDWNGGYSWNVETKSLAWVLEIDLDQFAKEESDNLKKDLPRSAHILLKPPPQMPSPVERRLVDSSLKLGDLRSELDTKVVDPMKKRLEAKKEMYRKNREKKYHDQLSEYHRKISAIISIEQSVSPELRNRAKNLISLQKLKMRECQNDYNTGLFAYHGKDYDIIQHLTHQFHCNIMEVRHRKLGVSESSKYNTTWHRMCDAIQAKLSINCPEPWNKPLYTDMFCKNYTIRSTFKPVISSAVSGECLTAILKPFNDHIHPLILQNNNSLEGEIPKYSPPLGLGHPDLF